MAKSRHGELHTCLEEATSIPHRSEAGPPASGLQLTGPLRAAARNAGAEHCGVQGQGGARKRRYVVRSGSAVCVGMTVREGAQAGPQAEAALRLVSEVWPARGGGMGGEQRLCWGRTKGEDKDYFKPVLITAPNRDWGWERQLSQGEW